MKKEYQTFIDNPVEGEETELNIKELAPGPHKYDSRMVKAILYSSPDKLPDGDTLWVRSRNGFLHPSPWVMKITEELGPFIPQPPYSDLE